MKVSPAGAFLSCAPNIIYHNLFRFWQKKIKFSYKKSGKSSTRNLKRINGHYFLFSPCEETSVITKPLVAAGKKIPPILTLCKKESSLNDFVGEFFLLWGVISDWGERLLLLCCIDVPSFYVIFFHAFHTTVTMT